MRERVEAAARTLGFTPNLLARSLIKQRSNIVALIITEQTVRFTPQILYRFGTGLQRAGLHLLLFTVETESPGEAVMAQLLDYPIDGLVSCATLGDAQLARLAARGVPVVLFNRLPRGRTVSSVCCDHAAMGATIARALHNAGHRRFAFVSGPKEAPVSGARERGFRAALKRLGVKSYRREVGDYSYESGLAAGRALTAAEPRPEAVFCANDAMALGVLDSLRFEVHLSVPEEISVVGFDDTVDAGRAAYRLTTARPPLDAMVTRAIEQLMQHRADPGAAVQTVSLPAELLERATARLR
jgi:DNA-binding LacI/PurR family transcriptional regulator